MISSFLSFKGIESIINIKINKIIFQTLTRCISKLSVPWSAVWHMYISRSIDLHRDRDETETERDRERERERERM